MSAPYVYKLKVPVALPETGNGSPEGGQTPQPGKLEEVAVRPPIVRDLMVTDAQKGEVAKARALLIQVPNLTPKLADQLAAEDFAALSNIIGDFHEGIAPAGTGA